MAAKLRHTLAALAAIALGVTAYRCWSVDDAPPPGVPLEEVDVKTESGSHDLQAESSPRETGAHKRVTGTQTELTQIGASPEVRDEPARHRLDGRVLNKFTGRAVPGASVTAHAHDKNLSLVAEVVCDDSGRFTISVPELPVRVSAIAPGLLPRGVHVRKEWQATGLLIELPAGRIVRGRLLAGQMITNVADVPIQATVLKAESLERIRALGSQLNARGLQQLMLKHFEANISRATTDKYGRFVLRGLPDLPMRISADLGDGVEAFCDSPGKTADEWVDIRARRQ